MSRIDQNEATWRERIARAQKLGFFSERDVDLARQWDSCAVGEYSGRYKVNTDAVQPGTPEDYELYSLGVAFYINVKEWDFAGALECVEAIEKRIGQLEAGW